VATEYLFIDYGGHGEAVEAVREGLPQLDVVPAFALIVEAIYPVNRGALVVTTEEEKVLWILDLICEE
jgi:hypothetical protein